MTRQILWFSAAVAVIALLAGCGLANPYASTTQTKTRVSHTTSTPVDRDPAPERGGTIPSAATHAQHKLASSAGQPTRRSALARYARLYINWTASDVAAQETELAAISLGSARGQARQAAASYRRDSTLLKSDVANTGTVVAITKGNGVAAGDWVLVTRETTTGNREYKGLPAQLHVTYAHLRKTATGWVISSWSPQS